MTNRRQWLTDAAERLTRAGASDARLDAEWLLAHATGMPRLMLLIDLDAPVAHGDAARFDALVSRRERGEPLQYVLGEAAFMGRTFRVDSRVLIPRDDTAALCEAAAERIAPGSRVLDIGAGSGAIAITLALLRPDARITAVDISPDALDVARANGDEHAVAVEWMQSDLFSALAGRQFDVIVSNPPYIETDALAGLQWEVRSEPRLALDGGADGLDFYRDIIAALPGHLSPGGSLLFEVGDGQARDVRALMKTLFDKTDTLRDLAGLPRVVAGDGYAG